MLVLESSRRRCAVPPYIMAPLSASLVAGLAATVAPPGPTVKIPDLGQVDGLDLAPFGAPELSGFLGIPYAAAPLGPLRWQPPVPHKGWEDQALNATAFGNICMQANQPATATMGEDCLFLVRCARLPVCGACACRSLTDA